MQKYFPYSGSWSKSMRATVPFHWLPIYRIIAITEFFFLMTLFLSQFPPTGFSNLHLKTFPEIPDISHV